MANRPEDNLPTFKILVVAKEYREYTVVGNGEDDARVRLLAAPQQFNFESLDDLPDGIEVVDIWEA
jgi:hypothetical protein